MKKLFTFIIILTTSFLYSQEMTELNTIVTINNEICKNQIEISFFKENDSVDKSIKAIYLPGKLKMETKDFEKLKEDDNKIISIEVIATMTNDNEVKYKKYIISNINFDLLVSDYFILKIYDLEDKKFKKIYRPIEGKCYTFEYDSPLQTIRRVRKR